MGLRKHQSETIEMMRRSDASEASIQRAISQFESENSAADKRSEEGFKKRQQVQAQIYGPLVVESRTASNGNKYVLVYGNGLNHTYIWSQKALKAYQDAAAKLSALVGTLPEESTVVKENKKK